MSKLITRLVGPAGRHIYESLRSAVVPPPFVAEDINYDEYWARREFIADQPRFPLMAELIDGGSTVLDIGCGDGGFLSHLKARRSVTELGIDISTTALAKASSRGLSTRKVMLFDLQAEQSALGKAFDYVVMSEVIEHVPNSEEFIRAAWALAGRRLIITFPNIAFWPHRLRLLLGRNPVQWVHFQAEHLRFWSVSDFTEWIQAMHLPQALPPSPPIGTSGTTMLGLHQRWPNFWANQVIVVIDRKR